MLLRPVRKARPWRGLWWLGVTELLRPMREPGPGWPSTGSHTCNLRGSPLSPPGIVSLLARMLYINVLDAQVTMSGDLQGSPLALPALLYSPSSTPRRSGAPPPRFPASPSANTGRALG